MAERLRKAYVMTGQFRFVVNLPSGFHGEKHMLNVVAMRDDLYREVAILSARWGIEHRLH